MAAWAAAEGLTVADLARIQPGYSPAAAAVFGTVYALGVVLGLVGGLLFPAMGVALLAHGTSETWVLVYGGLAMLQLILAAVLCPQLLGFWCRPLSAVLTNAFFALALLQLVAGPIVLAHASPRPPGLRWGVSSVALGLAALAVVLICAGTRCCRDCCDHEQRIKAPQPQRLPEDSLRVLRRAQEARDAVDPHEGPAEGPAGDRGAGEGSDYV